MMLLFLACTQTEPQAEPQAAPQAEPQAQASTPPRPPPAPRLLEANPGAPADPAALIAAIPAESLQRIEDRPEGRFALLSQGATLAGVPCAGGIDEGVLAASDCWTCTPWRDFKRNGLALRAGVPITLHYGSGTLCRVSPQNLLSGLPAVQVEGMECAGMMRLGADGHPLECAVTTSPP